MHGTISIYIYIYIYIGKHIMIIYHEVDNKKTIMRVQLTKNKMFKISLRRDFDEFEGDNKT